VLKSRQSARSLRRSLWARGIAIDAEYRVMSPASLTLSLNEMPGNRSNHGPLVSNMLTPLGLANIDF
jgi:hypothetical protein